MMTKTLNKNTFLKSCCTVITLTACIPAFLPHMASAVPEGSQVDKTQKDRIASIRKVFDERTTAKEIRMDAAKGIIDFVGVGKFTAEQDRPDRGVSQNDLRKAVVDATLLQKSGQKEDVVLGVGYEGQSHPAILVGKDLTFTDDHTLRIGSVTAEEQAKLKEIQDVVTRDATKPIFVNVFYLPVAKRGHNYFMHVTDATLTNRPVDPKNTYRVKFNMDAIYALEAGGAFTPGTPLDLAKEWDNGGETSFAKRPPNILFSYRLPDGTLASMQAVLSNPDATGTEFDLKSLENTPHSILDDKGELTIEKPFDVWVDYGGPVW